MKKIIIFLLCCLPTFAKAVLIEVELVRQSIGVGVTAGTSVDFFLTTSITDSGGNAFSSVTDATITIFSGSVIPSNPLDLSSPLDFVTLSSGGNVLGTVFRTNADLDPTSPLLDSGDTYFQTLVIPKDIINSALLSQLPHFRLTFSDPLTFSGFARLQIGGSYFYDDGTVAVNAPGSLAIMLIGLFCLALARTHSKLKA